MPDSLGLENQIVVALRRISRSVDLHSSVLFQKFGLTVPQLAALRAIESLEPVSVGSLAKAVHVSHATLTGILARLANRSLVCRSRSGTDRRSVLVELTDAGRAVLASAPSLMQDRFRQELLKLKDWEQTQLLANLQRVASMMDAGELEAPSLEVSATVVVGADDLSPLLEPPAALLEPQAAVERQDVAI